MTTPDTGLPSSYATAIDKARRRFPRGVDADQASFAQACSIAEDLGGSGSVAVGSITGLGTGIATALAINAASAGAPVLFNGAGGTPSSLNIANATGLTAALVNTALGHGGAVLADGSVSFTAGIESHPTDGAVAFYANSHNAASAGEAYGFSGEAYVSGAGSSGQAWGGSVYAEYSGSGNRDNLTGLYVYGNGNTGAGTVTNNYGIYIEPQAIVGASNWAIKTTVGLVEFGEHVKVEGVTSTGATGSGKFVFDTSPSIAKLANLTTNGHVSTSGGDGTLVAGGNLTLGVAGNGLLIKEGANATMGVVTLSGGTATVSTTKVTANSRIHLTTQALGTVTVATPIAVTARTAGTSFVITSSNVVDTSVVAWAILEPA